MWGPTGPDGTLGTTGQTGTTGYRGPTGPLGSTGRLGYIIMSAVPPKQYVFQDTMKHSRQLYSKAITLNSYSVPDTAIRASIQSDGLRLNTDLVYTFGKNRQPVYLALVGNTTTYGKVVSRNLSTWSPMIDASSTALSRVVWDGIKWIITSTATHSISTTYDQVTYRRYTVPNEYASIGFNPRTNQYVAIGNSGLYTSFDSLNWTSNPSGTALINNASNYHNGKVVWNGAIWVAAGNGGVNSLLYSEDGVNWYSGGSGIFDAAYGSFDVAWSGSVWVAVGAPAGNREAIAWSTDGRSWTTVALDSTILKSKNNAVYGSNKPVSIEWDGVVFVVTLDYRVSAGNHNYIISYDGITWSHTQGTIIYSANIAKWTGSNFVIAGEDPVNSILIKQNGGYADWHTSHAPYNSTVYDIEANTEFQNIIVFPRTLIIAGKNHSHDGMTWTDNSMNLGSILSTTVNSAATNGRRWVAGGLGSQNTLAYSRDGHTWFGGGADIFTTSCARIVAGSYGKTAPFKPILQFRPPTQERPEAPLWVAVGSGLNSLAYSYDGIYWIGLGTPFFAQGTALAYNGYKWLAGGSTGSAYSDDGFNWTATTLSSVVDILWTGSFWLAACSTGLYTSGDGKAWAVNTALAGYTITGLASHNNEIFALSTGTIYISKQDLGNWTTHSFGGSTPVTGFAHTGTEYLFSSGTSIYRSGDLTTWTTTTLTSAAPAISINNSSSGTAIAKPMIVACSDSTYNTLGYSYDGVQWYGCGSSVLQTRANHAAWNGSIWVAVGLSASTWFAISRDGIHWQQQTDSTFVEGYQVAWNGTLWVAVGEGAAHSIATSPDGILWTGVAGSKTLFSNRGTSIAWTGAQWVAYGSPAATATSVDGLIWTSSPYIVGDLSSVLIAGSSAASTGTAANAFDKSAATTWTSEAGLYNGGGAYTGSATLGSIAGEWLQYTLGSAVVAQHYSVCGPANNQFPKAWTVLGSNDGSSWTTIDVQDLSMATPTLATSLLFSTTNTTAYSNYAVVFQKTTGGSSVSVTIHDWFSPSTAALSNYHRVINTKKYVASTVSTGYSTLMYYRGITTSQLNGETQSTGFADPGVQLSSYSYNGQYSLITDFSNSAVYYNTDFSQNQLSTTTLPTTIGNKHTSCYNGAFFFVGGSGTTRILYAHESDLTAWYSTANADTVFGGGAILSLVSNPQIGFVVSPNTVFVTPGDKLSISAPRFYDENVEKRGATFTVSLI
jgi:hypothetical protein